MCGLTGFWDVSSNHHYDFNSVLSKMSAAIKHRGPDDAGTWTDQSVGVGLAHQRLAILDLSSAGQQPMRSHSGRYVIVFNGEIYNHLHIRKILQKEYGFNNWRGHSDTETLLAAIEFFGFEKAVEQTIGMFAIAMWDKYKRRLCLARDRMGEKPLYYGWHGQTFLFGSELKALREHPSFNGEINKTALIQLFRNGYISQSSSIYKKLFKVPPGSIVRLDEGQSQSQSLPISNSYWSLSNAIRLGNKQPFHGTQDDVSQEFERLLVQSLSGQMLSDVPLGAFLSGGIDSSTVVALMQQLSSKPVQTFSIGFHEKSYDEAEYAAAIARHLKTSHTELYVTPQQSMDVIPKLATIYDEPFADSSQIPTYLVSELASGDVTVCLSGDGGDELLGGYTRYEVAARLFDRLRFLPISVRRMLGKILRTSIAPFATLDATRCSVSDSTNIFQRPMLHRIDVLAEVLNCNSEEAIYKILNSSWKHPEHLLCGNDGVSSDCPLVMPGLNFERCEEMCMYVDTLTYLPDDILVKVDRAAMAVSLESRVPLIDHRIVEFVWSLPAEQKFIHGCRKQILRDILAKYVPKKLFERPKMGFGVPIDSWLRGPLRDWAEELLSVESLQEDNLLRPGPIRKKWLEHVSHQYDWQYYLWPVLIFQAWRKAS